MMSRMSENPILYKYEQYIIDKKLGRVNSDFKNIGINGENEMDEIIPNLWLGNYKAAYNYKNLLNFQSHIILTQKLYHNFHA